MHRGEAAAEALPGEVAYGGFSLGAMPAQRLAQTRPGAKGALLFHAAIPTSEFGGRWPPALPLQIRVIADDELGDVDVARELAETARVPSCSCTAAVGTSSPRRAGPTTTRAPRLC